VVWSAVPGATRYTLTRSVPPAPGTLVTLPNEADTQYVDRDIKPGSTYYYLVSAVNEAGISGMKMSSPPVKAADSTANKPPDPPAAITAVLEGSRATIYWSSSIQALSTGYLVERATNPNDKRPSWVKIATGIRCCRTYDQLDTIPAGTRIVYQISAVSRTPFTSQTGISNQIVIGPRPSTDATGGQAPTDTTTGQGPTDTTAGRPPTDTATGQAPADTTKPAATNVRPAEVAPPGKIRVGGSLNLGKSSTFTRLGLRKPRWLSLDESKATVNSRGRVSGIAAGFTYIVAIGLTPDGSVASMVQRVDVARR